MNKPLEILVQILIFCSLVCFTIETVPDLSPSVYEMLDLLEIFFIGAFTIEYFARIYFSENKLKFLFSFYGIVDLLAILIHFVLKTAQKLFESRHAF